MNKVLTNCGLKKSKKLAKIVKTEEVKIHIF